MPQFYETNSEPEKHFDCLIYERNEFGYPIFDIVVNGVCVGQYAGKNGAIKAAQEKPWEKQKVTE